MKSTKSHFRNVLFSFILIMSFLSCEDDNDSIEPDVLETVEANLEALKANAESESVTNSLNSAENEVGNKESDNATYSLSNCMNVFVNPT